jgi:hypothetical protein
MGDRFSRYDNLGPRSFFKKLAKGIKGNQFITHLIKSVKVGDYFDQKVVSGDIKYEEVRTWFSNHVVRFEEISNRPNYKIVRFLTNRKAACAIGSDKKTTLGFDKPREPGIKIGQRDKFEAQHWTKVDIVFLMSISLVSINVLVSLVSINVLVSLASL